MVRDDERDGEEARVPALAGAGACVKSRRSHRERGAREGRRAHRMAGRARTPGAETWRRLGLFTAVLFTAILFTAV